MGERSINGNFNVLKGYKQVNIVNPYRYAATGYDYSGALVIYGFQKLFAGWTDAVIQLRRSSDNATAYVFFDGNTITTSSFISTSSNTTPDATTLATWIGSDDGFLRTWYGQQSTEAISATYELLNTTGSTQPKFITSGAIVTKNSNPAAEFDGLGRNISDSSPYTEMDNGNSFTMICVASNDSTTTKGLIFSNRTGADWGGFQQAIDSSTGKDIGIVWTTITNIATPANYISQTTTTNQRLLTTVLTASNIKSYYNGTEQEDVAHTTTWGNSIFRVGRDRLTTFYLDGTVQEIIVYASDITADLADIHADVNSRYTIY